MDVEVFIYGTPIGNCFYGKADEKIYFDTFYNRDKANYLSVKIRKAGDNKVYCYYNYLVYQNVIGKQGRPDSFFGITLRLGAYCLDIQNIYRILDTVFNSYVIGGLLESVGSNHKYIVDNFDDTSKLKFIEDSLISLFSQTFNGKSGICFTTIDNTFTFEGGKLYTLNLYDYSDENIFQFIKETGQIRISPYYPTIEIGRRQQQHNKHLEEIRQQHESDRRTDLEEKNKLHNSLSEERNKNSHLQTELEQKKKDIEQLNGKIKNIERAKEVEYLIEQIKIPIEKLSGYIAYKAPVVANEVVRKGRKWYTRFFEFIRKSIPFVNMIFLILILFHVFNIMPFSSFGSKNNDTNEKQQLSEQVAFLEDENERLKKEMKALSSNAKVENTELKIDIKGNKAPLSKNQSYTLRAIDVEKAFSWQVEGATSEKLENGDLKITPNNDATDVKISLSMNVYKERTISVKR
ncbi:hypothetical protein [Parabacteroides sp.]